MVSRIPIAACACWLASLLVAQDPPRRPPVAPTDFLIGQDDNLFSLKRSHEDIHLWTQALDELAAGEHTQAVERLHRLLLTESGDVVPVATGRFYGLRLAVLQTLVNLPPAATAAYEALVAREAGDLANRPLHTLDGDQLEQLAHRFPTSQRGRAARLRRGDLALEAGQGLLAADHYRLALDAAVPGSAAEREVLARLRAANVLRQPAAARAAAAARRLPARDVEVLAIVPPGLDPTGVTSHGGGDGGAPMAPPAGRPQLLFSDEVQATGFDAGGSFALHAVGDLDGIYINTGRQLLAYDILRQGLAWESQQPLREQGSSGRRGMQDDQNQINQDTVLAAAYGGDVVVAALQVPDPTRNVDFHNGYRIISKLPLRRLFAWSRSTGKQLWAHFDEVEGPRTRRFHGHDACGPPLVAGDTVYVPVHDRSGAIAFGVAAYDLATGELRWRRLVCSSQQEVNMFGNARAEFAASPLTLADGVLYGAANLGVVFALERRSGAVRWISSHEVVRMPMTRFHQQQSRPVYFANNAPLVAAGVVCLSPLDSPFVLGLETETGELVWRVAAEAPVGSVSNDVRWLCGVLDDEFVLAGRGAVAVRARPRETAPLEPEVRQLVRPDQLRERNEVPVMGRPAVTPDHVWFPRPGRILGFDRAGNPLPAERQIQAGKFLPGNLLLVDGAVVALRQRALDVLVDVRALEARIQSRVERNPDDAGDLLRLASLRTAMLPADASPTQRAELRELYRRGLAASLRAGMPTGHPTRQALQRELYDRAITAAYAASGAAAAVTALADLAEAREVAPDAASWLVAQMALLERLLDQPARLREELARLQRETPTPTVALADGTPVPLRAYVLWREAGLTDQPAAQAVLLWQELLEQFPTVRLAGIPASELATQAIAAAIRQHGQTVYQSIAARAEAALRDAGEDARALGEISARFPNSPAAGTARARRLDLAVRAADLQAAAEVLAQALATGEAAPGLLRRVAEAARRRGNLELARNLLQRLHRHGRERSDWPDDGGAEYAAVAVKELAALPAAARPPALVAPELELGRVPARSVREVLHLRPVLRGAGFAARADEPLYAVANGNELLAIDLHAPAPRKPELFRFPVQFLEQVVVCDDLVVVPDLERLVALDYRSGALRWELHSVQGRMLDCLGLQGGVLHLSVQTEPPGNGAELLGIEPLTGTVLFSRLLQDERHKPVAKPAGGDLLWMRSGPAGSAAIVRLDATTGEAKATIPVAAELLQHDGARGADAIANRIYPQSLCANRQLVFLPIEAAQSGEAPRVVALDANGQVRFQWRGRPQGRLGLVACQDEVLAILETIENGTGQYTLLDTQHGKPLRQTPLGFEVEVLNWQRSWLPNPAPQVLLLTDAAAQGGRDRRLVALSLDPARAGFVEPLAADDGEIERQPLLDGDLAEGLLVYGVQPARGGTFRLHALRTADRRPAFADGQKYTRLRLGGTQGMTRVGNRTVIATADALVVYGPKEAK
jgi:hypothetical protein